MALTIPQLAYAIRFSTDDTTALESADEARLTRLKGVADAYVARYASTAPENIKDEAVILFTGYVLDGPDVDVGGAAVAYPSAWRNCGAESLVSPWRIQRAGILAPAGGVAAPVGGVAGGLSEAQLIALIDRRIAAAAPESPGQSPSPGVGLNAQQLADLQSSVDRAGVSISGYTLTFVDHEGRQKSIDVPGLQVFDEATALLTGEGAASANTVHELAFLGANVNAQRIGNRVTVTVSGLSADTVNTLIANHASLRQFAQFEAALRFDKSLVASASVRVAISNAAYFIPGNPLVPAAEADRELSVRVGSGLHYRIDVADLRAKAAVSATGTVLDDANSVSVKEGDDTYRFGRHGGTGRFVFGSDNVGTHIVSITDSRVDLQPEARLSATPLPDRITTGARRAIQAAVTGDITLSADGARLLATLKQNNIDPADIRFDSGSKVAGRIVALNENADGFEGIEGTEIAGLHGLQTVHDGSITGITVTHASRDVTNTLSVFSPTFDLDENGSGELHYRVTLTFATRSVGYSFYDGAKLVDSITRTGVVFASTLADLDTFNVSGGFSEEVYSIARVGIGIRNLQSGVTVRLGIGNIDVYLAHNTNGELGYLVSYDGTSGTGNFAISADLDLRYLSADTGTAAPSVPVPSGIQNGQLVRKSASGWEAVPDRIVVPSVVTGGQLLRKKAGSIATGWETVPDRVPVPSGIASGQLVRKTQTGWEAYSLPAGSDDSLVQVARLRFAGGATTTFAFQDPSGGTTGFPTGVSAVNSRLRITLANVPSRTAGLLVIWGGVTYTLPWGRRGASSLGRPWLAIPNVSFQWLNMFFDLSDGATAKRTRTYDELVVGAYQGTPVSAFHIPIYWWKV